MATKKRRMTTVSDTHWKCPKCGDTLCIDHSEIAIIGTPYCASCEETEGCGADVEMEAYDPEAPATDEIRERLEYLRGEIKAERISYGEIVELQSLAEHIPDDDVLLLEWAGVPEAPPAVSLERYMQIAQDIKKEFVYSKSEGKWYWHDRGEDTELSEPFDTFWLALLDAVAPYTEEDEENDSHPHG
jgi:hypothetical protein